MVSRYGYDVVTIVVVIVVVVSLLSGYLLDWRPLKYGLIGCSVLFLLFTIYFFRDPDRHAPSGKNLVLSPADGEVVMIKDVREDEFLHADAVQVSIFMSPLNVHVNRYPIDGTVGFFRYVPGEYLVAYEEKSSLRNERTLIGIENGTIRVLFKQIAGFIARRIVAEVKVGDHAAAGERFGMIKFGSRVDVLLPKSADVRVKLGDRTVAGETVLAIAL